MTPPPVPAASSKKKRKLSILSAMETFNPSTVPNTTAIEDQIAAEIKLFNGLKSAAAIESKYKEGGFFDLLAFFNNHQAVLPIHTMVYRADVGSMKGASASVETIFSGVKRLLGDFAATMSPEILELYVFIHYNWQYDFMRPTIDEIVKAYLSAYGREPLPEDIEEQLESDEEEDEAEEEQAGEDGADEDAEGGDDDDDDE